MSRSYKKTPVVKDESNGMKTTANRQVRRMLKRGCDIANGSAYRKLFCSYDICDWAFRQSWAEYREEMERYRKEFENGICRWGRVKDRSEGMNYRQWFKMFKRK